MNTELNVIDNGHISINCVRMTSGVLITDDTDSAILLSEDETIKLRDFLNQLDLIKP